MEKYKEIKLREERRLGSLQEKRVTEKAKEAFTRPAYQTVSVLEYMASKYKIGGIAGGDDKAETETVPGITERAGTE